MNEANSNFLCMVFLVKVLAKLDLADASDSQRYSFDLSMDVIRRSGLCEQRVYVSSQTFQALQKVLNNV